LLLLLVGEHVSICLGSHLEELFVGNAIIGLSVGSLQLVEAS